MFRKVCLVEISEVLSEKLGRNVVCLARGDDDDDSQPQVHCFIETEEHHKLTVEEVYRISRSCLSSHQLPARIHFIGRLPQTSHGKVDRVKLRKLSRNMRHVTGRGDTCVRTVLATCWQSVLGRSAEDSDNFISSGGDSFSALALYNILW